MTSQLRRRALCCTVGELDVAGVPRRVLARLAGAAFADVEAWIAYAAEPDERQRARLERVRETLLAALVVRTRRVPAIQMSTTLPSA